MNALLLIPVFLPLIAGSLAGFLPALRRDRALYPFVTVVLVLNVTAVIILAALGDMRIDLLAAGSKFAISLATDDVGRLFSVLGSLAWLITAVFSFKYMEHEEAHPRFFGFYLVVIGLLNALDYAENLLTMYLFFEFMTLLSMPLVMHSLTKEAISAGLKYLYYSMAGALMALFGMFVLTSFADTLSFQPGGILQPELIAGREGLFLWAVFVMIVGFCTKGGLFPMHAWLPTAHPIAPAPASAQLSAVITKAGVLCVIRTVYYIVGSENLVGTWVQMAWILLSLVTIFMGSMMAYREKLIKKRLAYSTVSQVSYIFLGLAFLTPASIIGALLHVVFHMAAKSALFLCAGAVIRTGKTRVDELDGLGISMPVTFAAWSIASLTLIGIPPTSAFLSKWYIATGTLSVAVGTASVPPLLSVLSWVAPIVLLISALLTAGYLLPPAVSAFFPGHGFDRKKAPHLDRSAALTVPVCLVAAAALLLGVYYEPLWQFITRLPLR